MPPFTSRRVEIPGTLRRSLSSLAARLNAIAQVPASGHKCRSQLVLARKEVTQKGRKERKSKKTKGKERQIAVLRSEQAGNVKIRGVSRCLDCSCATAGCGRADQSRGLWTCRVVLARGRRPRSSKKKQYAVSRLLHPFRRCLMLTCRPARSGAEGKDDGVLEE